MENIYEIKYNPKKIKKFYSSIAYTKFFKLSEDRKSFIEEQVISNITYFKMDTTDYASFVTSVATKLTDKPVYLGLQNDDEILYFYIKMVDPDFLFLEIYESFANKHDMREVALSNLGYYDYTLMMIEKTYNDLFQEYDPFDLSNRGIIKRTKIKID